MSGRFDCRILADSITPEGARLTTMEVTFPRLVLAEFNTHRVFSRNSASSRAIPVQKMLDHARQWPVIPTWWGANQRGMSASEELSEEGKAEAKKLWLDACAKAADFVESTQLLDEGRGLHKQIANRALETWLWHTVIVTATEWDNFFALRCDPNAQPEIRRIAEMMRDEYEESVPEPVGVDGWHLPLVFDEDQQLAEDLANQDGVADRVDEKLQKMGASLTTSDREEIDAAGAHKLLLMVSVARCARVSYLTHDGRRDLVDDLVLYNRLVGSGHMSPCEHVARPMNQDELNLIELLKSKAEGGPRWITDQLEFSGNFRGWVQYRKEMPYEDDFGSRPTS